MGEDISLFDAAFFNLAADVASVSQVLRDGVEITSRRC